MRRWTILLIFLAGLNASAQTPVSSQRKQASRAKPKLVLAIIVDQFRYDYVLRFAGEYREGLQQLLAKGAVFTNARYSHFPTFTSVGHAAFFTGASPSVTGIIGNQWFDRFSAKVVRSVMDDSTRLLGGDGGAGSSPRNLLVSTVGDELKISRQGRSRVIGISIKDYSAILSAGCSADAAYWYDGKTGSFVSSSYYFRELPQWVRQFNGTKPADRYKAAEWSGGKLPAEDASKLYAFIPSSPFGNDLVERMAEAAVRGERLGAEGTDLLVLSFSSNDYVGHQYGPDSAQVRETSLHTDRLLGKLFKFLDAQVGMANVLVVLAADHGAGATAEAASARKMPGGHVDFAPLRDAVQKALTDRYGEGKWILSTPEEAIYLNWELIKSKKLSHEEVGREAAQALLSMPRVFRVYTREQLLNGLSGDAIDQRVRNGFSAKRGADLYVLLEPYQIFSRINANHGTPFGYDTHVPVIFMGPGIKAGRFHSAIDVVDVAPTLATILETEMPSGAEGRILSEIFSTP
jgi:predicted AlkP superfamily pyrophosphatase or phosphodiesterase